MFYIAQIIGLFGLTMTFLSFRRNDKKELLKYQIYSSSLFAIQYLLLNAINGCLMNIMILIRNIIYNKYEKLSLKFVIAIIFIMTVLSLHFYDGIISLLPTVAMSIYTIGLWQENLTITRISNAIACTIFIIYNIKVIAISGLISTILELLFCLVAIYRFDIKKRGINKYENKNEKIRKITSN